MRVLWFAVTPSLYGENTTPHNGGGLIESLEKIMVTENEVQLGIAFEHPDKFFKIEKNSVIYYPISKMFSKINKLKVKYFFEQEEKLLLPECISIINDFKPDIIQVFGTEWCFGLISKMINIPVVIHFQGTIPSYYNARYPVGYNIYDFLIYNKFKISKSINRIIYDINFRKRAQREINIFKNCLYYFGRTNWDKNIVSLLSPNAKYFFCNEALRECFQEYKIKSTKESQNKVVIVSTISHSLYKGVDLVLKTAKLLKEFTNMEFEWNIIGVKEITFHEWKTKIDGIKVNINLLGTLKVEELILQLGNSDLFVHPSYIDNSPNSICEAQIMGLPVISTNVGGIGSLIEDNKTGFLIPANDPFSLAAIIVKLSKDCDTLKRIGSNARKAAQEMHDINIIKKNILDAYKYIISNNER